MKVINSQELTVEDQFEMSQNGTIELLLVIRGEWGNQQLTKKPSFIRLLDKVPK
jgi:hypothetical protein